MQPTYKLDPEEQDILDSYERGEWKTIKNFAEKKKSLQRSARATLNKTKNINIRLSEFSVYKLKSAAIKQGLPYQTLASSILHRYASGQTITP